jgi:hypothetical protein
MTATLETINNLTNDAEEAIATGQPFVATVTVRGTAPLLLHAWSCDAVAEKASAKKNSEAKKTDNVESYVYRNEKKEICLPGVYILGSMTDKRNGAAKFRQDPRSPRKSALDLYRGGVVTLTDISPILSAATGKPSKEWDYLDRRRVVIGQSAVTRMRPAFHKGWKAEVQFLCLVPEYISPDDLQSCLADGGKLVGTGDFRPTFGRFQVESFKVGLKD